MISFYRRFLGIPFVYNQIRPWIVGGIDLSPLYKNLEASEEDIILDIGCGTGIAMNYLSSFRRYHGFDLDPIAISHARDLAKGRPRVHFECRTVEAKDLDQIRPTRVIMSGFLHHLEDTEAVDLLKICQKCPSLRRIATMDVVFLPGQWINNLFAWLDRGRHVRDVEGYQNLVQRGGFRVIQKDILLSHPNHGRVQYLFMGLEPEYEHENLRRSPSRK